MSPGTLPNQGIDGANSPNQIPTIRIPTLIRLQAGWCMNPQFYLAEFKIDRMMIEVLQVTN
jgi:hypothetical protein